MTANPLKLSDTTFRDAHQSLMATRLRTEDMAPLPVSWNVANLVPAGHSAGSIC